MRLENLEEVRKLSLARSGLIERRTKLDDGMAPFLQINGDLTELSAEEGYALLEKRIGQIDGDLRFYGVEVD